MTLSSQPPTTGSSLPTPKRPPTGRPPRLDSASLTAALARGFGTLTVTGPPVRNGKYREVPTRCTACGAERSLMLDNLLAGKTTSCRCQRNVKLSESGTPVFTDPRAKLLQDRFYSMQQRCRNPDSDVFHHYGGRGIQLRFPDAAAFVAWVMLELPHPSYKGVSIDRIDNNGHYEPGNLRLATQLRQTSNTRRNRHYEYRGLQLCASHLWHFLKRDYPEFKLGKDWCTRLAIRGEPVAAILKAVARGGSLASSMSSTWDPDVVSLYEEK